MWEFLQITSPYALFADLKEFFTIKFADGGSDFDFDFVGVPTFGTGFGFLTPNSR
ncbi:hypothetical protein LEP1GSC039_0530 [Leptospira santarosai str. 2000027870]|nr:hypothetical protein LEP1GSC039_0530 [Leptospira santarosai str. 2000027870]